MLLMANLTTVVSFGLLATSEVPALAAVGQTVAPGALLGLLLYLSWPALLPPARLLRLAPQTHVLLFTMHHIVSDGWSMAKIGAELSALYGQGLPGAKAALPEIPIQFGDYAVWMQNKIQGDRLAAAGSGQSWTLPLLGADALALLALPFTWLAMRSPRPER